MCKEENLPTQLGSWKVTGMQDDVPTPQHLKLKKFLPGKLFRRSELPPLSKQLLKSIFTPEHMKAAKPKVHVKDRGLKTLVLASSVPCSIPVPYLFRTCSVPVPYLFRTCSVPVQKGTKQGTEQVRNRYGTGTEQVRNMVRNRYGTEYRTG